MHRYPTLTRICCIALLLLTLPNPGYAEPRPRVLVIESYHASNQWDADYTRAIQDSLSNQAELQFFQMDTKRRPVSEHVTQADLAWQTYLETRPDLVILGDDNALKHLGPRFAGTQTPVIYLGINNNPRNYLATLPNNITGILERPLLKRSIVHIQAIMAGELNKILILFDTGITSQTLLKEQFLDNNRLSIGSVAVDIKQINQVSEWHNAIATAPEAGYDAIIVGLYHTLTTANGDHAHEQEIITWSSHHTPVPLFAFWKFAVGEDMTIGGLVLDGYDQGRRAALIAQQALRGEALPRIPQSSGEGAFVFSRRQLDKWMIKLPDNIAAKATWLP